MNLAISDAASALNISTRTLNACIADGRLVAIEEPPGTFKISQAELERFAAAHGVTIPTEKEIDQ